MKKYIGAFAMLGLMMLAACSKDGKEPAPSFSSVRQIDITEVVPIHESSLEYFDYVLTYQDNDGQTKVDTIRGGSSLNYGCYIQTYSYTKCPVSCMATVEMVPIVPETEVVSFTFIVPKPYLTSNIYYSSSGAADGRGSALPEGYKEIKIDSMEIGKFLSTYGTTFISTCRVLGEDGEGIQITSY